MSEPPLDPGDFEQDEPARGFTPETPVARARSGSRSLNDRRYSLARLLLLAFGLASAAVLVLLRLLPDNRLEELRSIAPLILSPLATLIGAAVAWFYADRNPIR